MSRQNPKNLSSRKLQAIAKAKGLTGRHAKGRKTEPFAYRRCHSTDPLTGDFFSYTEEQTAWLRAITAFKSVRRRDPTPAEILALAHSIGYRKTGDSHP